MKRAQSVTLSVSLVVVALAMFFGFAFETLAWILSAERKQEAMLREALGALARPEPFLHPWLHILPGIIIPLALLGAAAFVIAGMERTPRPKQPERPVYSWEQVQQERSSGEGSL